MHVHALDHIVLERRRRRALRSAWYIDLVGLEPVRVDEWRRGEVFFPSVRVNDGTIIDLLGGAAPPARTWTTCAWWSIAPTSTRSSPTTRFTVVDGPDSRYGARGDGWSVYVNDPDGNTVEFRSYD